MITINLLGTSDNFHHNDFNHLISFLISLIDLDHFDYLDHLNQPKGTRISFQNGNVIHFNHFEQSNYNYYIY